MARTRTPRLNLKDAQSFAAQPAGKYALELTDVKRMAAQSGDLFIWEYTITEGKRKGKTVSKVTSTSEAALGMLRDHMEAHGIEIPSKDPTISDAHKLCKEVIGWTGTAEVLEREYQGRMTNDVVRLEGEEGEEEELEIPDADEVQGYSAKELKEVVDDHGLDIELSDYKTLKQKRKAVNDALAELREGEEEEEEEEEETDDWPTDDEIDDMDADELKALNEEGELGITPPRKGAAALKKFRKAIKEAVAEQRGESEELEPVARDRVEKMTRKALSDLIEEYELDFDADDSAYKGKKGLVQLRDEVAEKLDEEGLLEE